MSPSNHLLLNKNIVAEFVVVIFRITESRVELLPASSSIRKVETVGQQE